MSHKPKPRRFEKEPSVTSLPFFDRSVGRILLLVGVGIFLGALLGGLSLSLVYRRISPLPQGNVVVAARDLRPYQRLRANDVKLSEVNVAVDGTVLTNTTRLIDQAIVVQSIPKGWAVTGECVTVFSPTVDLSNTVILAIPMVPEIATESALEPGLSVLIIGTTVSNTVPTSTYSATVLLVDVGAGEAIVAISPAVAEQLVSYYPPKGLMILVPGVDR